MLSKLNDDSSTNDLWIWLADVYYYVDSGCLMSALENEIDEPLQWILGSVVLPKLHVGDSILTALSKMKQTDQHQHSYRL